MQSFSTPSMAGNISGDTSHDVMRLEKLLNKVFGDELERALSSEYDFSPTAETSALDSASSPASNLVEFPLVSQLVSLQQEQTLLTNIDLPSAAELFEPVSERATYQVDLSDPLLATDLTKYTPSIICGDDSEHNKANAELQMIIDVQQQQLATLREQAKQKDFLIRCHTIDLAAKDDQLKYVPELLEKALQMATVEQQNQVLNQDLTVEKLVNDELTQELAIANAKFDYVSNHLLVKFGRILGLIG
jgi:hypothetical protein